ncbi:MAG: hypothetical protein INH34_01905 [Phycisphaerales bacterium]|nr:hypothetical protein [Phycisphaerales bacterium]
MDAPSDLALPGVAPSPVMRRIRLALRILFVAAAVGAAAAHLGLGWPGAVGPDMRTTIFEGRAGSYYGHQEPMFGFLWSILLAFVSMPVGVVACFVAQIALYWTAAAMFADAALARGRSLAALGIAAVACAPPFVGMLPSVESNIQTAVAWLAAAAIAATRRGRGAALLWGALLWYGFVIRSGMVLALLPAAFACRRLARPDARLRAVGAFALVFAVACQGASFLTTKFVLGDPTRASVMSVSRLFDLAGVHQLTGVHHVPAFAVPPGHTAAEVMANYTPKMCSGLFWRQDGKPVFRLARDRAQGDEVAAAWWRTVREEPMAWLQVKLRYAALFLHIGVEWADGFWLDSASNEDVGLPSLGPPGSSPLDRYGSATGRTVLWKGWFWLLATGVFVLGGFALRLQHAAAAAAAYAAALASIVPHLLFGQAVLARYHVIPFALCFVAIALTLLGSRVRRAPASQQAA